jgi:hypothetical protein
MSKVVRYFHIRLSKQNGGATVMVTGDPSEVGHVAVQVAKCSKKDMFCKRTGREEAAKQPVKLLPLRYLPNELGRVYEANSDSSMKMFKPDFTFSTRYFLPKS